MSWMDWGDVRAKRGSTPTGKTRKNETGWKDGAAAAADARVADRKHKRAVERYQQEALRKAEKKLAKDAKKAAKKARR